MGKLVKVLIGLFVLVGLVVGGAIFYVTTKIKPEDIKKLAIEATEKALPGTNVKIQKVDYSIGTSFSFELDDLEIKLKKDLLKRTYGKDFFEVGKVNVKVPLWALITNGGTISINVDSPEVTYKEFSALQTNISLAMGPKKKEDAPVKAEDKPKETDAKQPTTGKVEVPAFVKNSKINIRLTNVGVNYSLYKSLNGKTKISRIVLKNIGLSSPSAFEIASDIKVNLDAKTKFSTNLLVIGDLDLKTILDSGEISTNIHVTLSKIAMSSLPIKVPDVKASVKVNLHKDGKIDSKVKVDVGSVAAIALMAYVNKEMVLVNKIDIKANLENAVGLMPDLKEALKDINLNGSSFFINGDAKIITKGTKLSNNINFGLTKDISIKLVDGLTATQGLSGSFKNTKVGVIAKTGLAGGEISTNISTVIDPMSGKFAPHQLKPIYVKVVGGNMKITKDFIQKTLYKGKKTTQASSAQATAEAQAKAKASVPPATKTVLPITKTTIDLRQIYVDRAEIKVNGNIHTKGNKAYSKDLVFIYDKGTSKTTFDTTLVNSNVMKHKFTFNMKGLDFSSFDAFLPQIEMLKGAAGFFNGSVKGSAGMAPNKLTYNVDANINVSKVKAKGVSDWVMPKIKPHLSKVKLQENDIKIPDNFEAVKVKTNATEKNIKIFNAAFLGPKHLLDVFDIKGNVSMLNKPSQIDFQIRSKNPKTAKKWKEKYGLKAVPFRLTGKGFGLGLDTKHLKKTLTKVATNIAKNKAKKAIKKKLEEKVGKKLKGSAKKKFGKMLRKFKF